MLVLENYYRDNKNNVKHAAVCYDVCKEKEGIVTCNLLYESEKYKDIKEIYFTHIAFESPKYF